MSTREAHLLADVYYLIQRAAGAGHQRFDAQRDYGVSSNAIVQLRVHGCRANRVAVAE